MNIPISLHRGMFKAFDERRIRITSGTVRVASGQYIAHCFDGHAAGDIARQRASHSVCDYKDQTSFADIEPTQIFRVLWSVSATPGSCGGQVEQEKVVFVAPANAAYVCLRVKFNQHG